MAYAYISYYVFDAGYSYFYIYLLKNVNPLLSISGFTDGF